jgi:EpsI family protein
MIFMAGHSVRVAESCTALGFMKWLLVFALAYAYLFPVSRLHAAVLILSAPVIAYMVNLLRGFSLVLNPGLEVLEIHIVQGIVFFLIGFSVLYALDTVLLRLPGHGKEVSSARNPNERCEMNPDRKHKPLLVLLTLFSLLFVVSLATPRWSDPFQGPTLEIVLADEMGDWKLADTPPLIRIFLGSIRYSSYLYRDYARNGETVSLFIGYDDRRHRDRSLLSEKNAYQDGIGLVEERSLVELKARKQPAVSILTSTEHTRIVAYHWYEGIDSVSQEVLRALLALDQSPLRRPGGALVIRVATHVAPTPQGIELADKRLRDFLHDTRKQRQKKQSRTESPAPHP